MLALIPLCCVGASTAWLFGNSDLIDISRRPGNIEDFNFMTPIIAQFPFSVNKEHLLSAYTIKAL
jgi:hypothetical protein